MPKASFRELQPASAQASAAARGASKKTGTKPELLLRRALWRAGLRYRTHDSSLRGRPDIVLKGPRVAVFCDGDFWHGRDWESRRLRLEGGHNAGYWVAKIERNIERDRLTRRELELQGWTVVRVWEGDLKSRLDEVVEEIRLLVRGQAR
mgnify:CR=1 FL=1